MIDNKIIHNYLDSQIKYIDELMKNHLLTLKKIFHIINKAKKNGNKIELNKIERYYKNSIFYRFTRIS